MPTWLMAAFGYGYGDVNRYGNGHDATVTGAASRPAGETPAPPGFLRL